MSKVKEVPYDGRSVPDWDVWDNEPKVSPSLEKEHWFTDSTEDLKVAAKTPVRDSRTVKSRIRVQLSRPLTWAEAEDLTTDGSDPHLRRLDGNGFDGLKLWVSPTHTHVWAEAPYGSRHLFELVASFLETSYVNVYPKAVRTFREYNGE